MMAHGYLNYFVTYMTAAERAAFTPDPPEVASGMPAQGYLIYETDTGKFWTYDGSSLVAFDPSEAGALLAANNLDDVDDAATARTNLDVYSKAQVDALASGGAALPVSTQAGTAYTAVLGDANTYIRFTSGSAVTFTLPPNSSVALPVGTVIEFEQGGAGTITVAGDTGVTVNCRGGLTDTAGQYAVAAVKQVDMDTWTLTGDVA